MFDKDLVYDLDSRFYQFLFSKEQVIWSLTRATQEPEAMMQNDPIDDEQASRSVLPRPRMFSQD